MIQFLVSLPIMAIWIIIASTHGASFSWWVWIINGAMSTLAAKGIMCLCEELAEK